MRGDAANGRTLLESTGAADLLANLEVTNIVLLREAEHVAITWPLGPLADVPS